MISVKQERLIRKLVRQRILEQSLRAEKRTRAINEFKIAHTNMLREGYTLKEANMLILEVDFLKALGFGGISGLKQQVVTSVLKDFNIPTNTLSGKFLVNIIENIGVNQIMALFGAGPGECDAVVELLARAAMETITEYGAAKLIAYVFEKTAGKTSTVASAEIEKTMNTFIGSIGVEVVNDLIYQYFKTAMLDELANKICNDGIMSFVSSARGGDDAFAGLRGALDALPPEATGS